MKTITPHLFACLATHQVNKRHIIQQSNDSLNPNMQVAKHHNRRPSTQTLVHLAVIGVVMTGMLSNSPTAQSQTVLGGQGRYNSAVGQEPTGSKPLAIMDGMYAANAKVGRINVSLRNAGVPADGQSILDLDVEVFDLNDAPMAGTVIVTVENNGGKLQLQGASTDEFGPGRKDADRLVPGTQIKVENGKATISLIAPNQAQDVTLRLTAGMAEVTGIVPFNPDVREMIAAGLVEGTLRLSKKSYATNISPVRMDDGFEQEIRRFSKTSQSGSNSLNTSDKVLAARAALFLKGKISGDALLTLSFDSDKETRARLLRDIKPDDFYPVYGDASIKGFDARSSDRLYVRVDQNRSFVMYGDFNTGAGFSQSAGSGVVAGSNLRQLATYNRTMTGVKAHAENETGFINAFISRDSLKNTTEELRANGTSGPFAIGNATALENSEKIELLTRDRNNLSTILSVTQLERLNDYVFEPFSARILLSRAIPSVDANGNPLSLRISYEVDQGGKNFLVAGVDGQINLGKNAVIGGALIQDKNPLAPSRIAGINAGIRFGETDGPANSSKTTLIAEIAQSKTGVTPVTGTAARVELAHQGESLDAKAYINRKDDSFNNQSNGSVLASNGNSVVPGAGSQQIGASVGFKVTDKLSLNAGAQQNTSNTTDAKALGATLGVSYAVTDKIAVKAGLRHSQELGVLPNTVSGIGCNPAPGSAFSPANSGGVGSNSNAVGFNGAGSSTLLNLNGNCAPVPAATATNTTERSSNTLVLGLEAKVTDQLSISASIEGGKANDNGKKIDQASRFELGISYQVAERTRLYAKVDSQRGLASQYSLEPSAKSQSLSLGIDSTYMQGGNVFSEYRLRDSIGGQESQIASGLRNAWQISDGILLSTGAERLKLLAGAGQNATALTAGVDFTQSELWKAGGRVEWRRLDGVTTSLGGANPGISQQDTLLFTLNASQKIARDWTILARNYYLATNNRGAVANGWQDRFQLGAAYRPVDNNALDVLSKLEYKTETNINGQNESRQALIAAVQANYHPSRAWWLSARLAAKYVNERFPINQGGNSDKYKAYLIGGRLIYDLTENIDLGLNLGLMSGKGSSQTGVSVQKGIGLEVGYRLATNLWGTLGYNIAGYSDKDLSSDYTSKGVYLKLRYKFDQDLFESNNPAVNNLLEPRQVKP